MTVAHRALLRLSVARGLDKSANDAILFELPIGVPHALILALLEEGRQTMAAQGALGA